MTSAPSFPLLISAVQLQNLQASGRPLMVFDCSFDLAQPSAGMAQYQEAHIPGALYADLDKHLSARPGDPAASGGRHPLPSREAFAAWLRSVGFNNAMQAVVYDRQGVNYCGRLWWMLKWAGHENVAVLDGGLQAWLAPGGALPVVFAHTVVWFTAGSTTYEFEVFLDESSYEPVEAVPAVDGTITIGRVQLTPDQKLLIVALCENVLRRGDRGAGHVPQSGAAAQRLGWTITKFNRKLDNVCEKLSELGVRGLRGGPTKLASSRKARLVEYAMAARVVTADDLDLLP